MEKDRYDREDDASKERGDGVYGVELEQNSKHRSKDKKKSIREEEKDHRGRDRERERSKRSSDEVLKEREKEPLEKDRVSTRERRKDDRDEHGKDRGRDSKVREKEKDYDRDKYREKEHEREREKDRKDRGKEKERERERDRESEKERGKDKGRDREKERDKEKEKEREKEREKLKDREKEREGEKDRDREKGKERTKQKNREADPEKERSRDRVNAVKINQEDDYEGSKDGELALDYEERRDKDEAKLNAGSNASSAELEERIVRMKEERLKKKSEGVSEVSTWVSKSRKLEEKRNAEKEKALQLSKIFEEQDNFVQEENEDEKADNNTTHDLAGVKVLHGLDKVIDGGAVVLTLKDQSILANGDINEDVDMLENIEIGEQKRRDDAYKAAKKKTGVYDDKLATRMIFLFYTKQLMPYSLGNSNYFNPSYQLMLDRKEDQISKKFVTCCME